jgi:oligoendopeptidase F
LKTESQFREIAKVPEEQVQAVLDKVVEESKETGKPITARAIKEAAEQLADTEYEDVDPPEPTPTTTKAEKPKEQQLKELAALGSKYVDILMRTLDDMQAVKKSDRHESGLKSCRELKKFFGTW